jgi:hypothetical protein
MTLACRRRNALSSAAVFGSFFSNRPGMSRQTDKAARNASGCAQRWLDLQGLLPLPIRAESVNATVPIGHQAALRQLANRLVAILHGCLKTGTPYHQATAWAQHRAAAA